MKDATYKSPATVIHYLINNVSKNGHLLLNTGPRPDGTIPEETKTIFEEMGLWLSVNSEAIYATNSS